MPIPGHSFGYRSFVRDRDHFTTLNFLPSKFIWEWTQTEHPHKEMNSYKKIKTWEGWQSIYILLGECRLCHQLPWQRVTITTHFWNNDFAIRIEVQKFVVSPMWVGTHAWLTVFFLLSWGTTTIFLWPCVNRDKSYVSGTNFIELVPCNPVQSRSFFLDYFDLWSRWKLKNKTWDSTDTYQPF